MSMYVFQNGSHCLSLRAFRMSSTGKNHLESLPFSRAEGIFHSALSPLNTQPLEHLDLGAQTP